MKRLTLLLCATFMFATTLSAQDNVESTQSITTQSVQEEQVGAQGTSTLGFNVMYNIPSVDADSAYGLTFELLYGKYVARNLNIEGGLGVYHGGYVYPYIEYSSTSLGIPINIGYRMPFSQTGLTGLRLYTGPKLTLAVAGKGEMFGEEYKLSEIEDAKRFNAFWSFGINFDIYMIGISAEYMVLIGKKSDFSSGMFGIGLSLRY